MERLGSKMAKLTKLATTLAAFSERQIMANRSIIHTAMTPNNTHSQNCLRVARPLKST